MKLCPNCGTGVEQEAGGCPDCGMRWNPDGAWERMPDGSAPGVVADPDGDEEEATDPARDALEDRVAGGAHWFYWIAWLSVINTLMIWWRGDFIFLMGPGITQLADYLGQELGGVWTGIAVAVDIVVVGLFVLLGWAAQRRRWVFVAGMSLYAGDLALAVYFQVWGSVVFHLLALYFLWGGYRAARALAAYDAGAARARAGAVGAEGAGAETGGWQVIDPER